MPTADATLMYLEQWQPLFLTLHHSPVLMHKVHKSKGTADLMQESTEGERNMPRPREKLSSSFIKIGLLINPLLCFQLDLVCTKT